MTHRILGLLTQYSVLQKFYTLGALFFHYKYQPSVEVNHLLHYHFNGT